MNKRIFVTLICFMASANALANHSNLTLLASSDQSTTQSMSAINLKAAKPMRILHGEWPPLPAALSQYNSNCTGSNAPKAIVARLSPIAMLWGLCTSVTVNNTNYTFFIVKRGKAQRVKFAVPSGIKDLNGVLPNPGISNEDRVLSSFSKGRGHGDCGVLGQWIWDGSQFRLLSYRAVSDCNDAD